MRVASAFMVVLALAGATVRAGAADPEPIPLRLELAAPSGCPDSTDFRRELERRGAATRPASPGEKAGLLRVAIVKNEGTPGVAAHLSWIDAEGTAAERQLDARDCRAAEDALALIAAMALSPGHAPGPAAAGAASSLGSGQAVPPTTPLPTPPPTPAPPPAAAPSSVPAQSVPAPSVPAPPATAPPATAPRYAMADNLAPPTTARAPAVSFSATAAAFVAMGAAPEPAFGVSALAGVALEPRASLGPVIVRVGIAAIPTHAYSVDGATATFGTLTALAEVCPLSVRVHSRVLLSPCALGEFGAVTASGPNQENALSRPWVAAGIEARASIQLIGALFFDASLDGLAALDRDRFRVGSTLVYETPAAVGRFSLGLGWIVP